MRLCEDCGAEFDEEETYYQDSGICNECWQALWDMQDYQECLDRQKEEEGP